MNLYQALFKQCDDSILILEGELIYDCNQSLLKLWGEDFEDKFIGNKFEDLFSSEYLSSAGNLLEEYRYFNNDHTSQKKNIVLSISTSLKKIFVADVSLSKISKSPSQHRQGQPDYYTLVTIKPQKDSIKRSETIDLGGQEFTLTTESLLQFITQVFHASSVGIAVSDFSTGRYVAANQSFLGPLKYDIDELLNLSTADITPAEYLSLDLSALKSIKKTGFFPPYKKEYTCKGNSTIQAVLNGGVVVRGMNQDFILWFVEDISHSENIKRKLKNKVDRMNLASVQACMGIWEMDFSSGEFHWSDEIYQVLEIDKENFNSSYEAFLATIYPTDKDRVINAYQKSLIDQKPYQLTHRLQMPDGRIKFVNVRCTTSFDRHGAPINSIGTVQDITAVNHSRVELQRSPILEASRDFIGISDLEGRVTFINQAGRHMLGGRVDLDDEVWQISDLYDDGAHQKFLSTELVPLLNAKGVSRGDFKLKNLSGGKSVLVDCDAFRVDNPITGEPICFATVSQDITARKAAELELHAYKKNLEQRVKERTVALQQAKFEAVIASKAKSVFLSRMSHELRTPLNAVLGFSQLIKAELISDTVSQVENINEVLMAGGHLLNLIDDILDISLIERGEVKIQDEHININQEIKQSLKALSSSMAQKEIKLIIEESKGVAVKGDVTRVYQVLSSVLSNAVNYNKQGGSVEISVYQPDKKSLTVAVKDTGIGMEGRHLDVIFEPFERVDYDTSSGSGIGLTLVKELMNLMGGDVRIESTLGQGTTVYLDFLVSNIEKSVELTKEPVISQLDNINFIQILYIEDVSANMRLMRRILAKLGDIKFLEATTGKAGIDAAKEHLPNIILLDINLPDMTGFDVLKQLKKSDKTKDISVIAISANAFPEDIEHALKQGFDGYVTKPFDYAQLLAKVSSFIDRGKNK
jgi:signal transduction histidine kinase/CheY-like chemotaxis protein